MKERLTNDLKAAMKEQNKELLSVLRMEDENLLF